MCEPGQALAAALVAVRVAARQLLDGRTHRTLFAPWDDHPEHEQGLGTADPAGFVLQNLVPQGDRGGAVGGHLMKLKEGAAAEVWGDQKLTDA